MTQINPDNSEGHKLPDKSFSRIERFKIFFDHLLNPEIPSVKQRIQDQKDRDEEARRFADEYQHFLKLKIESARRLNETNVPALLEELKTAGTIGHYPVDIEGVERRMRYQNRFLTADEHMVPTISQDNDTILSLGLTNKDVVMFLQEIFNYYWDQYLGFMNNIGQYDINLNGQTFHVKLQGGYKSADGWSMATPFMSEEQVEFADSSNDDNPREGVGQYLLGESSTTSFKVTKNDSSQQQVFSDMNLHLARDVGFYGGPLSAARIDPRAIVNFFDIKPKPQLPAANP